MMDYEDEDEYDDEPKTMYEIVEDLLYQLPSEESLKLANERIDRSDYSREQRKAYPVLFRERVTEEERAVIKQILSAMRITGLEIDHESVVKIEPTIIAVTKFYCPVCRKVVSKMLDHYNESNYPTPRGWKCQSPTKSKTS